VEGEFEYVDNAPDDTNAVVGNVATGPKQQNPQFRHWLRHVGSPQSRIDGCIFSEEMVSPTREQIRLKEQQIHWKQWTRMVSLVLM